MKNNTTKSNIDFISKIKFHIKKLSICNFRNHKNLQLSFSDKDILLYGLNGVGKTNILEAISFLTSGRGLRKARIKDPNFIDFNKKNDGEYAWSINSDVVTPKGMINIGTGINLKNCSRIVKIENETSKQSDLSKILKISWITPQMLLIFQSNMQEKRRFVDRLINIINPQHVSILHKYEKLIRERAKIFNDFNQNYFWLDTIEKEIIKLSIEILKNRNDFVLKMNDHHVKVKVDNKYFPKTKIVIKGEAEKFFNDSCSEKFSKEIFSIMKTNKKHKNLSFPGPHKSEINIYRLSDKKEIQYSSTGEQKIILISLIFRHCDLMQYIYNQPPILLLDDIIEHLDEKHTTALFKKTSSYNAQCWFTSTNHQIFKNYPNLYEAINVSDIKENDLKRNELKYA